MGLEGGRHDLGNAGAARGAPLGGQEEEGKSDVGPVDDYSRRRREVERGTVRAACGDPPRVPAAVLGTRLFLFLSLFKKGPCPGNFLGAQRAQRRR